MASPLRGKRFLGPPKAAPFCLLDGLDRAFSGVFWMRIPQLPQFVLQVPALFKTLWRYTYMAVLSQSGFSWEDSTWDLIAALKWLWYLDISGLAFLQFERNGKDYIPSQSRPMWMMRRLTYPSRMASKNWPVQSCVMLCSKSCLAASIVGLQASIHWAP